MDTLNRTVNTQSIGGGTKKIQMSHSDSYRNEQQKSLSDPRIDSPEISVVYPSVTHDLPRFTEVPETGEPETEPMPEETGETCSCKDTCKTDWLTAIKSNGTPFLLMALLLLVLGYALGRGRSGN